MFRSAKPTQLKILEKDVVDETISLSETVLHLTRDFQYL